MLLRPMRHLWAGKAEVVSASCTCRPLLMHKATCTASAAAAGALAASNACRSVVLSNQFCPADAPDFMAAAVKGQVAPEHRPGG